MIEENAFDSIQRQTLIAQLESEFETTAQTLRAMRKSINKT
jgi:hypothetical protein